jgi:hypothetical protein
VRRYICKHHIYVTYFGLKFKSEMRSNITCTYLKRKKNIDTIYHHTCFYVSIIIRWRTNHSPATDLLVSKMIFLKPMFCFLSTFCLRGEAVFFWVWQYLHFHFLTTTFYAVIYAFLSFKFIICKVSSYYTIVLLLYMAIYNSNLSLNYPFWKGYIYVTMYHERFLYTTCSFDTNTEKYTLPL